MILGIQSDRAETFECIYYLSLGPIPWAQLLQLGWAPSRTPWAQLLWPRPFLNPHGLNYISYYLPGIFFVIWFHDISQERVVAHAHALCMFCSVWFDFGVFVASSVVWPCSNLHLNKNIIIIVMY